MTDKIEKTDEAWRAQLSRESYQVLRHEGTEPAGTSPLNDEKRAGTFVCAGCGSAQAREVLGTRDPAVAGSLTLSG
jgi:peptide methionine sulfoxide reductase MsrB